MSTGFLLEITEEFDYSPKPYIGEFMQPFPLLGLEFIEFTGPNPDMLRGLFRSMGFGLAGSHKTRKIEFYKQNEIHLLLNNEPGSFAARFSKLHGPCIPSMGWRVKDAKKALEVAVVNGAKECKEGDYGVPAVYGIGDSLIYFIDDFQNEKCYARLGFDRKPEEKLSTACGFLRIDHLTNNVPQGDLGKWSDFYKNIFGFTEVRYFDIRGKKTGLKSFALRSPCGTFCIPINEGTEEKSQINEYLREYHGSGIQHVAFLTTSLIDTLSILRKTGVQTLEVEDSYYQKVFDRVPNVTEPHSKLQDYRILIDGDEKGYLLQIFTKNLIGPIFFEFIQRKNHLSFGEGNFGALFRSIEKDQEERGTI